MPSTPITSAITFFLRKKINSCESDDDVLKITYNADLDLYNVTYTDKTGAKPNTWLSSVEGQTKSRVMRYVRCLLKSLVLDEEGYQSVQLDVPGLPQLLTRVSQLRDLYVREHLEDMVELGLDLLWDGLATDRINKEKSRRRTLTAPEDNPRRPSHIFFSDDE